MKKGYKLPRAMMANPDLARLINSDEVQSVVKPQKVRGGACGSGGDGGCERGGSGVRGDFGWRRGGTEISKSICQTF